MRICFVCTGNICRSPMADVMLREKASRVSLDDGQSLSDFLEVSSAGTGNWHVGEGMDPRAREALERSGYQDHGHEASQISVATLDTFDVLVALDRRHYAILRSLTSDEVAERVVLLRSFDPDAAGSLDVPDPYYDGDDGFDACLRMIEAACEGLVMSLAQDLEV